MALAKKKKALGSVSAVKKLKDLVANKPANSVVMTFTPVVAEYILDNMNVGNRPQKPSRIVRYAADMANDNWSVTGESIKFGADGKLKDGQNRLAACVRSNFLRSSHMPCLALTLIHSVRWMSVQSAATAMSWLLWVCLTLRRSVASFVC